MGKKIKELLVVIGISLCTAWALIGVIYIVCGILSALYKTLILIIGA